MIEFLIETHMHTSETSPCGKVGAHEGIRLYKEMGYHGVVITDHFYDGFFKPLESLSWEEKINRYLAGYRAALNSGAEAEVTVILGMEFCFQNSKDDILAYGFDERFLYENEDLQLLTPKEFTAAARKAGILLIQAHPFRKYISRVHDEMIEGMEVFNGNPRHDSDNARAASYAVDKGLIAIAGSDFHQKVDAGAGGIYLPTLPKDSREFANILRKIRTPRLAVKPVHRREPWLSRFSGGLAGR